MLTGGTLFEELGFYYVGPIDGHNIDTLVPILQNVRDAKQLGPVLVHVVTEKGKGHPFAKPDREKYHAVSKFDRDHRGNGERRVQRAELSRRSSPRR